MKARFICLTATVAVAAAFLAPLAQAGFGRP